MHTSQATWGTARHNSMSDDSSYRPLRDDARSPSPGCGVEVSGGGSHTSDAAQEVARLAEEVEGLRRRLLTQPTIEQAKGLLIGFYGIDPDTAFAVLVRWSQHTNTKLHRVAADLVAAAGEPGGHPHAALQRFVDDLPKGSGSPVG